MKNIIVLLCIGVLSACAATPNPTPDSLAANGPTWLEIEDSGLKHGLSNVEFPLVAGEYRRSKRHVYNGDGNDVSVTYKRAGGNRLPEITLYVTQGPWSADAFYQDAINAIAYRYKERTVISSGEYKATEYSLPVGKYAVFKVDMFGSDAYTGVWVARQGDWLLKARFSYRPDEVLGSLEKLKSILAKAGDENKLDLDFTVTSKNQNQEPMELADVLNVLKTVKWPS